MPALLDTVTSRMLVARLVAVIFHAEERGGANEQFGHSGSCKPRFVFLPVLPIRYPIASAGPSGTFFCVVNVQIRD